MKKYIFAALLLSILAFVPKKVAAQAPSPFGGSADFMRRMNTYNAMRMNARMNGRRHKARSVKSKKSVRRRARKKTVSFNFSQPKFDLGLISPKRIALV
jgi:hypothetical protein